MAKVKIAIVGGGSYQWSTKFLTDIALTKDLSGSEVLLDDINTEALMLATEAGKKIIKQARADISVCAARDKKEALDGADFVILTISTGGLEAMRSDIEIPKKYGIYQSVGDTCGPGGISRSLRNIPVVIDIARMMERSCPQAYLMNHTNPLAQITRAVRRETKIKCVGFCHELFWTQNTLRKILNVHDDQMLHLEVGGINHLPWIFSMRVDGEDAFPQLHEYIDENKRFANDEEPADPTYHVFQSENRIKFELFKAFGALPAAGDRHLAEFFPYFLTAKSRWGEKYGVSLTPIEHRYRWLDLDKKRVEKIVSSEGPIELKRSGESAASFISAIANNRRERLILNIPNKGAIPGMMDEAIVEIFGDVDGSGTEGVAVRNVPAPVLAILKLHAAIHELTVEAAITGDRNIALQAFLLDPMMREFDEIENMMEELLEANRDCLPRFF